MTRFPRFLSLCACIGITAGSLTISPQANAMNAQEQAAFQPLQRFLDGLAKYDPALMREQALPSFHATLMRDGKPQVLDLDGFLARLPKASPTKLLEKTGTPSIHLDDNVGVIWVPYVFYVDDKPTHCGSNVVTVVQVDKRWLIASVADTARKDCSTP
ncbi:MAG: hypothetical protein GAK28_04713 [Luteibacter sp.]|uniref:hypothetical protein n=1 Tax=Luteibacter sp. TaxID=1886636 RepID=UPI0013801CBA|nr:hypothetical protein [Luteibacter sp.]KAF1003428.1 MAG: hypothetical protein GAK28_04713 [Luteibacter sp.]